MPRLARYLVIALALALALANAPLALAEPTPEDKALAQQLYDRASEAYSAGDYDQSIEWLERAYQLDPDPVILYNLGRSYEGAAQLDKARETLEAVEQNPDTPDEIRQRIKTDLKRIANLSSGALQQGQLTVTSSPDKARLLIDGRVEGTTPFAGALPVGEHTIMLQKDGYESVEQTINIARGETTALELSLLSLTAFEDTSAPTELFVGAGIALGIGAIGIGTGIGTAIAANGIYDEHCNKPEFGGKCDPAQKGALDEGKALSTVSIVGYAVGGVAAATGVGLLIWALAGDFTNERSSADTTLRPALVDLDPARGTVTLGWTF